MQAYRRRSLALALIAIGFAAQWISWARIDRAAFQYHYYTALPFVVLALAYFLAELWHGASRYTWLLARLGAAIALVLPAVLWLLSRPLCGFVGVLSVNPGSQACPAVIPTFVLTARTAGLTAVVAIGLLALVLRFLDFDPGEGRTDNRRMTAAFASLARLGVALIVALLVVALLPDSPVLTLASLPVEPIALLVGDAPRVLRPAGDLGPRCAPLRRRLRRGGGRLVRDPVPEHRRAAVAVRDRQCLPGDPADLPVRLPVPGQHDQSERADAHPDADPGDPAAALVVTCLVVAYSAWVWRLSLADSRAASPVDEADDGRIRTGGA